MGKLGFFGDMRQMPFVMVGPELFVMSKILILEVSFQNSTFSFDCTVFEAEIDQVNDVEAAL